WVCGGRCWTDNSWRYLDTLDIGISGFEPLPDNGVYHIVNRLDKDTHPEGTYGMPETVIKLEEIAQQYFYRTDRKLSINDLSLPKGGLFDYKAIWAPPHKEHRIGTDADINRTDGGGVFKNCHEDDYLKRAIKKMTKGQLRPRLKCEDARGRPVPLDDNTGLYKHIDFD
ncbi:MAG: penicillin-insensitive murein endopeptidase, partial [Nitrospinota bacterium]